MSKRLAVLAATTTLAALAVPAAAQGWQTEGYAEAAAERALGAAGGWQGEPDAGVSWDAVETYSDPVVQDLPESAWQSADPVTEAVIDAPADGEDYEWAGEGHRAMRGHHGRHHDMRPRGPRLAYGAEERAEWLSQCRALRAQAEPAYYYEEEDDADGGLIGGLLGAVVGGFAGNRIADGDRLLGTVIGAGVGGVAGAVIGSVIDGLGDDDDERVAYAGEEGYGFDYCEAYLLNWERGYGVTGQVAYAPVAMVPLAGSANRAPERRVRHRVVEEEVLVDEAEHRPAQRRIRRAMPPRETGKRLRAD